MMRGEADPAELSRLGTLARLVGNQGSRKIWGWVNGESFLPTQKADAEGWKGARLSVYPVGVFRVPYIHGGGAKSRLHVQLSISSEEAFGSTYPNKNELLMIRPEQANAKADR
jgi:hypothetical protein